MYNILYFNMVNLKVYRLRSMRYAMCSTMYIQLSTFYVLHSTL